MLVRSVESLVRKIVRKYAKGGLSRDEVEDLRAAGREGAFEAARRFDVARGNEFSTYAMWWIRGMVQAQAFDIWARGRYRSGAAKRVFSGLGGVRGRGDAEVAKALRVDPDDLASLVAGMSRDAPLDEFGESIADGGAEDALAALCAEAERMRVRGALGRLRPAERRAVELVHFEGRTLREVGAEMGCSGEWVSRLLERAYATLRRALEE